VGRFGLFGGFGEFDDWAAGVHRQLVEAGEGDGSVQILPMALGKQIVVAEDVALYRRLGIPAEIVDVTSRPDAERPEHADALSTASLIFVHGGRPAWVCDVLRDTPVWRAILQAIDRGASLAGTSGGIMCLGRAVPSVDRETAEATWVPGLSVFPEAVIAAHWASQAHEPLSRLFRELTDRLVVAVAERTAALGDGIDWSVFGEGSIHVLRSGNEDVHASGGSFRLEVGARAVN
jgi:cyanophycinase-like exopeptidase